MRILILSFYYQPDLSAGSFRMTSFVDVLASMLHPGDRIEVLTTLPNRYSTFSEDAPEHEERGQVSIRRVKIRPHQSGMIDQAVAYVGFAWQVLRFVRKQRYDVVFATSSRLFTAFLGGLCAKRTGARFFLDVRDILPDTLRDVLRPALAWWLPPLLRAMERFTIDAADSINLVSEGFREYFERRYPGREYSYCTNGIDEEFLNFDFRRVPSPTEKRIVLYAGNIGEGQGLHRVVPELAQRLGEKFEIRIVGDGGRKQALIDELARTGTRNVTLLPPVKRNELLQLYRDCDYIFLHLNDFAAFRKVLPSKIFEYAATGKPILAGVAGYPQEFLSKNVDNVAIFPPCNAEAGVRALHALRPGDCRRDDFISRYRRGDVMHCLAKSTLALAGPRGIESHATAGCAAVAPRAVHRDGQERS